MLATENGSAKEIDAKQAVRGQITSRDGRRSAVFLRYREPESGELTIKVYSGKIRFVLSADPVQLLCLEQLLVIIMTSHVASVQSSNM